MTNEEVPMGKRFLLGLTLLLLISVSLFAQNGTNLSGRVTDETGAALPGVTVTATNDATGFNRSTVTAPDGSYRLLALPIGTYSVLADLSGFASVTTKDVQLQVATDRTLNIS